MIYLLERYLQANAILNLSEGARWQITEKHVLEQVTLTARTSLITLIKVPFVLVEFQMK